MYGYIVPDKSVLKIQDFVLYRAFYCGLCESIGRQFGQFPRYTTSYDFTFFSVFLHDCLSADVTITEEKCVGNPFRKKAVVKNSELLDTIAAVNIILSYYKAVDGVRDGEGSKMRIARRMLEKPFMRAKKRCPEIEEIARTRYEKLYALEQAGETGIDRLADCFASMLKDIAKILLKEKSDGFKEGVMYNVGKFVYLTDALDDVEEDFKKKRYNPLLKEFGNFTTREKFIADNYDDLCFMLTSTLNRAIADFNNIGFTQSYDLMRNILYDGMRAKIKELLSSKKKLPKPKI